MKAPKHFQSRKFTSAIVGTACVLFVFVVSVIALVNCPAIAPQIVNLANIAIVFLGSITGVLVSGQSFVDWKHGSQSQFTEIDENRKEQQSIAKNINEKREISRPRDFDSEEID